MLIEKQPAKKKEKERKTTSKTCRVGLYFKHKPSEHDLAEILRRLALIRIKSQEKDIF